MNKAAGHRKAGQRPESTPRARGLGPKVREAVFGVRRRLAQALDPGPYFECPCCGERAKEFLPHGVKVRENAKCPTCGSLERHRLQWLFLKDQTNLFKDQLSVLHFAPEAGLQKHLKALPNLDHKSADLGSKRADEHFDICAIPYPDNTFDVILCSHVLEHVPEDRKAMAELFRVMKPGGWGLIDVPRDHKRAETFEDWSVTSDADRERVFGQRDHVRIYGKDYFDRLRAVGFEVTSHYYGRTLLPAQIEKYRLHRTASITIATKPAANASQ